MAFAPRKGLRKHSGACVVTKTDLLFGEHVTQSGICSVCMREGKCEIGRKAREGTPLYPEPFGIAQFGAEKILPNIEDIQIIPELWGNGVWFNEVSTEVKIGGFKALAPIVSTGLGSTKVASDIGKIISAGCAAAGIPRVIGENVLVTFGENGLKELIDAYKSAQRGYGAIIVQINANEHKLGLDEIAVRLGADAIEMKIGQGAKQGLGGEIQFDDPVAAEKYKKAGYHVVQRGKVFDRHAYPGDLSEDGLRKTLIQYANHGKPIWVKTGLGHGLLKLIEVLDKIKTEQGIPLNSLTIDGFGGGTGMSPWHIMNECSIPSGSVFSALGRRPKFDLLLAGGYSDGASIAKGIMLGADGIALGRSMIIAAFSNKETGIQNFVKALRDEIQMICATQKVRSVTELKNKRGNLFALSTAAGKMFGLPTEPKNVL
ncbi:MAG: glutamate synthase-related protein [Candidatus Aenigmatarchaeota archaeon]|nr:alpha-hydroxy-acid oxidizing protein [Candidatus Aenigmarchaeota archaeon]